ncbi:hypothetical protein CERSUDRAFT_115211 [Gelatoporia subvermispora B]|uniref:Uncharacterized protein n=1 Tax=Ceriporiopsis subvermispora (strain B) TaxID=914234 RepID=M2PJ71_CERS8|nr:hypothetical protein CERSUDRAFT_115211 [Gelatoporia subvermispora B]
MIVSHQNYARSCTNAPRYEDARYNGYGGFTPETPPFVAEEDAGPADVDMDLVDQFFLDVVQALEEVAESQDDAGSLDLNNNGLSSYPVNAMSYQDDVHGLHSPHDLDMPHQDSFLASSGSSAVWDPESFDDMLEGPEIPPTPYFTSPELDGRSLPDDDEYQYLKSYSEIYGDAVPPTPVFASPAVRPASLPPVDEDIIEDPSFLSCGTSDSSSQRPGPPLCAPRECAHLLSLSSVTACEPGPLSPQRRSRRIAAIQAIAGVSPASTSAQSVPRRRHRKQRSTTASC